jgi:type IV secretory pathway TraG/TraD family ATPase VirD4
MGSGKSVVLMEAAKQLSSQLSPGDTMVVFAGKDEILRELWQPGDVLISYSSKEPGNVYNIFSELQDEEDPAMVLREITNILFGDFRKNTKEPFFVDAAVELFSGVVLYLLNCASKEGWEGKLDNAFLLSTLEDLSQFRETEDGRKLMEWELLISDPESGMQHCAVYLGDTSNPTPLALSVLSQLRAMVAKVFIGSFAGENGTFNTTEMLKRGGRLFLLCEYAVSGTSSLPVITSILNSLLRKCLSFERERQERRCYFILDEFSLLNRLEDISAALGYGRASGFRLIYALQTLKQLERNHTASEAEQLLSLTANHIVFQNSCHFTREFYSKHYGSNRVQLYDQSGRRLDVVEEPVIGEYEFRKLNKPGECIMAFSGYDPFIYHGYDPNRE